MLQNLNTFHQSTTKIFNSMKLIIIYYSIITQQVSKLAQIKSSISSLILKGGSNEIIPKGFDREVKRVFVSSDLACLITTQEALECFWLRNNPFHNGQTPLGQEKDVWMVVMQDRMICAIDKFQDLICWDAIMKWGDIFVNKVQFHEGMDKSVMEVSTNRNVICILKFDLQLKCCRYKPDKLSCFDNAWVPDIFVENQIHPKIVRNNSKIVCTIDNKGILVCWDINTRQMQSEFQMKSKAIKFINMTEDLLCLIDSSNRVTCQDLMNFRKMNIPQNFEKNAQQVSMQHSHQCIVQISGKLQCWDIDGNINEYKDVTDIITANTGRNVTCVVHVNYSMECFREKVGTFSSVVPKGFFESGSISVASSINYNCAIDKSNGLVCWMNQPQFKNNVKQVDKWEKGTKMIKTSPQVRCALNFNNLFMCWQRHSIFNDTQWTVVETIVKTDVITFDVNNLVVCAINKIYELRCWVQNGPDPKQVFVPNTVMIHSTKVTMGANFICAIDRSSMLLCWNREKVVKQVSLKEKVKEISAGQDSVCFIDLNNNLHCTSFPAVEKIMNLPQTMNMSQISVGKKVSCGIERKTILSCWNEKGMYVQMPTIVEVKEVSVGFGHVCIINGEGELLCYDEGWHYHVDQLVPKVEALYE